MVANISLFYQELLFFHKKLAIFNKLCNKSQADSGFSNLQLGVKVEVYLLLLK
jgi:hypothetical protein